ncbi:hypothetical protein J9303_04875 [Bacillaceae bacterium Marseille-Q3522]|nr:hypothetical protein [Bacillaceae bacterium Marseille-Q3522]
MDKGVIIGTFEFLGFELCKQLLEQGIEVIGVHIERNDEPVFGAKRLQIGRNANFTELRFQDWLLSSEDSTVYIDFYDFYYLNNKRQLFFEPDFIRKVASMDENKVIILMPVQFFYTTDIQKCEDFSQIVKLTSIGKVIYLPTVYGAWQPANFAFQKAIQQEKQQPACPLEKIKEWRKDAIHIEETAAAILTLSRKATGHFPVLLKSEVQNHWQKCADFLQIPIEQPAKEETVEEINMNSYLVKDRRSIFDHLNKQKEHYERIKHLLLGSDLK